MFRVSKILVAALALSLSSGANAAWHKASTKHFVIYADLPPEELTAYAKRLEAFDGALRFARGIPDYEVSPANKLQIFAVKGLPEVQQIFGGGGVGGFYVRRAGATIAVTPLETQAANREDMTADVAFFHEYAHHLAFEAFVGAMPVWLSEGSAEFYSTVRFEPDGSVGFGEPARHRAFILTTKIYAPLPIEEMLGGSYKKLKNYYFEELYARGWLLYHYLTFNTKRVGQLERYIAGIQSGKPALESAREAFGSLRALESELDRYVRSMRFPYIAIPPSKFTIGPVKVERLSGAEATMMPVHMRSISGPSWEEVDEIANIAERLASYYPKDPLVLGRLAEAQVDAERFTAGMATADRAIAADPRNIQALLAKANALISEYRPNRQAADFVAARELFLRANRVDPENPRPLIGFYDSFVEAGLKPTENAVGGLLYAFELAPGDPELRWKVVMELIRSPRHAEAAKAIVPIAFFPHGGKFTDAARLIYDRLAAKDLDGARKALADEEKRQDEEVKKARAKYVRKGKKSA